MATTPAERKITPWIFNAFAMTAPGHLAPGLWRHPKQEKQDLKHWVRVAQLLDEANFHGLFFADVAGIYDVYKGNGPALQSGAQVPIHDISLLVSAMAHATKNLVWSTPYGHTDNKKRMLISVKSFGITASTTLENPYALARKFSTLDHITEGRVGWNIVTSYLESAYKSYGFDEAVEHDERYAMADEFLEVVYKLWENSWEDDAVQANKSTGIYTDPEKVHKINHVGKYYKCAGPSIVEPSPQRTPFLLQAGASSAGKNFAARHAEAMFLPGLVPEKTRQIVDSMRKLLVAHGRPSDAIKFIAGIFIVVDETDELAQAKFEDLVQYADIEGTAALFGGWTGTDLSKFEDDEDFAFTGPPAIQSMISAWTATVPGTDGLKWTKRQVLQHLAISGAHPRAIGSPTTVANILQKWVDEAGVDGFNTSYATNPGTFEDMIKYLWPELKKRGVLQDSFAGHTMRENFLQDGKGPKARATHPAVREKTTT